MATTLKELEALFQSIGWKYESRQDNPDSVEGYLFSSFPTKTYRDADGDSVVTFVFNVQEKGELIKIVVPRLYSCVNPHFRRAFFEVAIRKTFEKKLCFYDYDHRDGEIRMLVDLPLEDTQITERQVKRVLRAMLMHIDGNDEAVRAAVEQGELPFIDYKADLTHEISSLSPDQQLELLVEIKRRNRAG
ncbi:hypothetical protein [Marinobacterium lutimaris]|uniref:Sensory transduction regulator n=1 Tax=Marinobacterium lutimaris TaxID=568106 RepID=A0A1H6CR20_9GAMM|nr:hypothetical protein [Marinobacterium lutimaris]SEG75153.1 hypothetical protein SAMN05444390_10421 [Marinobacterium lutimaris]